MTSIKRKTFALVILSVLTLLVAFGSPLTLVVNADQAQDREFDGAPSPLDPVALYIDELINPTPVTNSDNLVPNIVGETFEHGEFNLRDSIGRPTIINFWHYGCEPCTEVLSILQALSEQYGDRVDFIGVLTPEYGSEQEVRAFLDGAGITFPNLMDGTIQSKFRTDGYLLTLAVNADQTEYGEFGDGTLPLDSVKSYIEELLNPVPLANSVVQVPNIIGETFEHGEFNLRNSIGRPTIINFWYHGCGPCADVLATLHEAYGDRVDFIGVFTPEHGSEQEVRAFLDDAGITFPNLIDGTIQSKYGSDGFPQTLIVKADQTQYRVYDGGPFPLDAITYYIEKLISPVHFANSGDRVPNIIGETFEHGELNLRDSIGRPTIINFWYYGCGPCTEVLSGLQNLSEQYGDQVDIVGVLTPEHGTEEEIREFLDVAGITYPNLIDGTIQSNYRTDGSPLTIVVNADQTLYRVFNGGPLPLDAVTLD